MSIVSFMSFIGYLFSLKPKNKVLLYVKNYSKNEQIDDNLESIYFKKNIIMKATCTNDKMPIIVINGNTNDNVFCYPNANKNIWAIIIMKKITELSQKTDNK